MALPPRFKTQSILRVQMVTIKIFQSNIIVVQLIIRKISLRSKTGEQKLRSFEPCIKKERNKKGKASRRARVGGAYTKPTQYVSTLAVWYCRTHYMDSALDDGVMWNRRFIPFNRREENMRLKYGSNCDVP